MAEPAGGQSSAISLRLVSVVTLFSLGQMFLLFGLQLVLAHYFGAAEDLDAYLSAYAVPLVVGGLLSGSLSSAIIPIYNRYQVEQGREVAEAVLNRLGLVLTAGSIAVSAGLFFFAAQIVPWLYPGFDNRQLALTTELYEIVVWLLAPNTLVAFLFSVFHCRGRFVWPAVNGLIGPLVTIVFVMLFPGLGIDRVAWGVLAGAIAGVIALLGGFPKFSASAAVPWQSAGKQLLLSSIPLVLGSLVIQLQVLIDRSLGSALTAGSISHLSYAWRIITAVMMLSSSGLSIVIFPLLAKHSAAGAVDQLKADLAEGWRFLCVLIVPLMAGMIVCGEPLLRAAFERGAFSASDTHAVALYLAVYSVVILAAGASDLLVRTFYAHGKMWPPVLIGTFSFTLGFVAKYFLVGPLGATGLATATAATYVLNACLILLAFQRLVSLDRRLVAGLNITLWRTLLSTSIAIAASRALLINPGLGWAAISLATAVLIYVATQFQFQDPLMHRAVSAAISFLRTKKN